MSDQGYVEVGPAGMQPEPEKETSLLLIARSRRRSKKVSALLDATTRILDGEENEITVRHLFYRLSSGLGLIPKTEPAYKNLCKHLARWRRNLEVAWDAFADSTRWHIREQTFDGTADALQRCRETYRRDMWATQPHYVELWLEKDAVASIVAQHANEFGVPVFVCRGFASLSSLYGAAQVFNEAHESGKTVTIFHLGDYDPSGHAAADAIERTLRDDFGCELSFKRLAVTREQIRKWKLPTRPTKETDSRTRNWGGGEDSVELDSIPPKKLTGLVEDAITDLIDPYQWSQMKQIEDQERATLDKICAVI